MAGAVLLVVVLYFILLVYVTVRSTTYHLLGAVLLDQYNRVDEIGDEVSLLLMDLHLAFMSRTCMGLPHGYLQFPVQVRRLMVQMLWHYVFCYYG